MTRNQAIAIAVLVFILLIAIVGAIALLIVLVFAGPHSDLLPSFFQPLVIGAAWGAIVAIPFISARLTYRWLARRHGIGR